MGGGGGGGGRNRRKLFLPTVNNKNWTNLQGIYRGSVVCRIQ